MDESPSIRNAMEMALWTYLIHCGFHACSTWMEYLTFMIPIQKLIPRESGQLNLLSVESTENVTVARPSLHMHITQAKNISHKRW